MESPIRWNKEDIARVENLNRRDGWENHLPITKMPSNTPTGDFYEVYIHILEGDTEWDDDEFRDLDFDSIDWQEIKIATQKLKGEEPEEYSPEMSQDPQDKLDNMRYVRNFLLENFGKDFGLTDPRL